MFVKKFLFLFAVSVSLLHGAEFDIGRVKITPAGDNYKFAAEELQKHLLLAGAPENPAQTALEIIIGKAGEKVTLKPAESRYLLKGNKLYVWGDDTNRRNGTLSGVYALLENKLNARWIFPGDDGIVISPVKKNSPSKTTNLSAGHLLSNGVTSGDTTPRLRLSLMLMPLSNFTKHLLRKKPFQKLSNSSFSASARAV